MSTAIETVLSLLANHSDVIQLHRSEYRSETLTQEDREWADQQIAEATRTRYYDLTPEQCDIINEITAENYFQGMARFTYAYARDRVGLKLVIGEKLYKRDEEGEILTDDKGKEIVESVLVPDYDFSVTVKVEGLTDCEGTVIPKGTQYFKVLHQDGNRPRTKTNYEGLTVRLLKWMLNGEQLIKDSNGKGITEQHRCIARCLLSLTTTNKGKQSPIDPDFGPKVFFTDGIHPLAAITADTGKSNSGKDIFASDPELCPPSLMQTPASLMGNTAETEYLPDRTTERVRSLGKTESATKMVICRLAGKQVNASLGNSNEATELAHNVAKTLLPNIDELVAACHVLACPRLPRAGASGRISKTQPVSPNDMAAALAVYQLREAEPVNILESKNHSGTPLDEATPIRFDVEAVKPLLAAMFDADNSTPTELTEWLNARNTRYRNASKGDAFSQLLRMIVAYFDPNESVTEEILSKDNYKPSKGSVAGYYGLGGADVGSLAKVKKDADSED